MLFLFWEECAVQGHSVSYIPKKSEKTISVKVCLRCRGFILRATQLLLQMRYSDSEARTYITLPAYTHHHMSLSILPSGTMEVFIIVKTPNR